MEEISFLTKLLPHGAAVCAVIFTMRLMLTHITSRDKMHQEAINNIQSTFSTEMGATREAYRVELKETRETFHTELRGLFETFATKDATLHEKINDLAIETSTAIQELRVDLKLLTSKQG